ncbi:hypothetical protein ACFPPF_16530 [Xenophilus aerolatus]|nr:hypothetical protein [Xenophilus aerolatus]
MVDEPAGPYSPIPDLDSILFSGSSLALERKHAVDLSQVGEARDCVYQAADAHGQTWYVRRGGFGLLAFRERTASELVEQRDLQAEMRGSFIPQYRLGLAWLITMEISRMVGDLKPERVCPRADRRRFKTRVRALLILQMDLLEGMVKASAARERMRALGL